MTDSIHRRDGTRFANKKDLILSVKAGEIPVLEGTSPYSKSGALNHLPLGEYWVVGPEPENRRWYAAITVKAGGRIHVK